MRISRVFGIAAVASVLAISACSTQGGAQSGGAGSSGKVELTYAYWDSNLVKSTQELVDKFNASHPGINVKPVQTAAKQYWPKLQAEVAGGNPPDVVTMNGPNFKLYASNGALLPISDLIARDKLDMSVYPANLNKLYTSEGKQYGISNNFATIALWYNKKLFDDAKVAYPTGTWTWEDVKSAAKKITDKQAGVYGIAAGADPLYMAQENYYNTIFQAGGYVISEDGKKSGFDDPKTIQGLQFWRDLLDMGVSPTSQQMAETPPSQMFASGKIGMYYGGTWRAAQWKAAKLTDVDVAPLPAGPAGKATTVHGTANVIIAKTKHPKEAWEFLRFMGSKESQEHYGASGVLLTAYQGTQEMWLKSMPEYHLQAYIDQLPVAMPFPVSRNTTAWNSIADEIFPKAWSGQETVEAAAKEVASRMNAELAKEK